MDSQRILLVDDNAAHRNLAKRSLNKLFPSLMFLEAGDIETMLMVVHEASNARQEFAVAIVDLNLGSTRVLTRINDLRQQAALANAPIVIWSTSKLDSDRQEALAAGADYFITKDATFSDLLRTIQDIITATELL